MTKIERPLYRSFFWYALNQVLLPLKLLIPQPVVGRVPFLKTNAEIRTGIVLNAVRGRLLDIGCGSNRLVIEYRARGGHGIGVDVYPWSGVDLLVEDTSRLPFGNSAFDTICFVACINHIPNREDVLREAHRLLAPNGRVVLTNLPPRLSRLWHIWAFWDEDQYKRGMAKGEVWGFTDDEIVRLLAQAKFEPVSRHRFSWGLNTLYMFRPICATGASLDGGSANGRESGQKRPSLRS